MSGGRLRSEIAARNLVFGAAPLGNLYRAISDEQAREALEAAWDSGVRHFDTAPHYGLGLSERRLGAFLRDRPRDEYTISTTVGRLVVPNDRPTETDLANGFDVPGTLTRRSDVSEQGIRTSLEQSLERLGLDRVDILYLHDPDESDVGAVEALEQGLPALDRMREEGLVRGVGVGTKDVDVMLRAVESDLVDLIMCSGRYTLYEQPAAERVLPACLRRDVDVVGVSILNSGLLARHEVPDDVNYEYGPAPREVVERVRQIAAICERHGVELPTAAIQFPLRHDRVIAVAVGSATPRHVREAVERAAEVVPEALWADLEAFEREVPRAH